MPTTRHSRATQRRTPRRPGRRLCRTDTGHRRLRNHNNKCLQCRPVPLVRSLRILLEYQWISNNSSSLHSRTTVNNRLPQPQHINSSIILMRTTAGRQCIRLACNNSNIRLQTCHLRPPDIILDRSNSIRTSVLLIRIQTHRIIAMILREANHQVILTDQVPITTMSNPRHAPR